MPQKQMVRGHGCFCDKFVPLSMPLKSNGNQPFGTFDYLFYSFLHCEFLLGIVRFLLLLPTTMWESDASARRKGQRGDLGKWDPGMQYGSPEVSLMFYFTLGTYPSKGIIIL